MANKAFNIAKALSDASNSNIFSGCEEEILNVITDYFADDDDNESDTDSVSDSDSGEEVVQKKEYSDIINFDVNDNEHVNPDIACALNFVQFNEIDNNETESESESEECCFTRPDSNGFDFETIMKPFEGLSVNPDSLIEKSKISNFECKCAAFRKGFCYKALDLDFIYETRLNMQELDDYEKNLIIIAKVSCNMNRSKKTNGLKHKPKERAHQSTKYFVEGINVCREAFKFVHGISQNRLTGCIEWYKDNGLTPKTKKSGGRRNMARNLSHNDIQQVVMFIVNFAEDHALILPGRVPSHKDYKIRLLPSCTTKSSVFRLYKSAMDQSGDRAVKNSTFRKLWKSLLPYIVQAKPMTDLCWTCQKNNYQVYRSANMPDIVKTAKLKKQEEHLRIVEMARQVYKDMTSILKTQLKDTNLKLENHVECSSDILGHYSFDFAQQVHIPSDPLQPGPMYFLTPRKCGLFGICCEGLPQQVNYLIDEGSSSSKGSSAVISYLHHFFIHYSLGEKNIDLHCDNCSGQNKNKFVLWYLAWRVLHGFHHSISLNFLISGHTKFSPDWCFGLIKQKFRKTRVCSVNEFAEVVKHSTLTNVNIAQKILNDDGSVAVPMYDWSTKFGPFFKPLHGIKKIQHFRFCHTRPGMVFYKEFHDSVEKEFCLLKDPNLLPSSMTPDHIPPPGLSLERQWYLFNSIREFCSDETQDTTCPKPDTALPKNMTDEE